MIKYDVAMSIKSKELLHKFIQKEVYESFLLDLVNNNDYFENKKFEIIQLQSNGEYDFICVDESEIQYEVTLLLNGKITKELSKDLSVFGSSAFFEFAFNEQEHTLIERLEKKKQKNNIIVFNILPFKEVYFTKSLFLQFSMDKWDFMIDNIKMNNKHLIEDKKIILVTFTMNNEFLIRELYPNNSAYNKCVTNTFDEDIFPFKITKLNNEII